MSSAVFKQRQKQHLLTALRESPKPIPGLEMIHLAAVVRRCLGQGMPMVLPVAEAAPEGSLLRYEDAEYEDEVSVIGFDLAALRYTRYSLQGVAISKMPLPIKLHTA